MSENPPPVIEVENLRYSYRSDWSARRIQALHGISLSVHAGESFGFLGHNGAGKTTTIKCLLGLVRADSGTIRLFGESHTSPDSRRAIGYLPEQPYFYDHLTVHELMTMYAHLAGIERGSISREVAHALDRLGMLPRAKSPMRSLSKGLTQRVGMAQAILGSPKLLILDEPFSGLDPIGRKQFKDLLFEVKAAGTTIFISSHILGDIEFLCDRASIMAHGHIREVFEMSDLPKLLSARFELVIQNYESIVSELRALPGEFEVQGKYLKAVFDELEAANRALSLVIRSEALLESYQTRHGSLEDLFVKLVQYEEAREG